MNQNHKMVRISGLAQRQNHGRKTIDSSTVMKSQNVKAKGLFNGKQSKKSKTIAKGKSTLASGINSRTQGTIKATKQHGDRNIQNKLGAGKSNSKRQFVKPMNEEKDDSLTSEDQKRNIRYNMKLDPYDISNKRLDDDTPRPKVSEKKEKEEAQVSKNAQFRALKPSPAILSYISNNLIGRRRSNELRDAGYNISITAPLDNIPHSKSKQREQIGENVFRNKLEFFASAKVASSFPQVDMPEIAFAGRSNVGKSSLLNALTRQWGVVRTSDKPGLTQTLNFFKLGSKVCLVDLPGYGFAYAKDEVKESWEQLVKEYVQTRVGLNRVCLLVDTKWGMKPGDHELINLMESAKTKYQIVLTKTDLVLPIDVGRRAMQIQEEMKTNKLMVQPMMMVSSKSGAGLRSLRASLSSLTRFMRL